VLFIDLLAHRNAFGLLSKDIYPETAALWGNIPQTYSMAGIIDFGDAAVGQMGGRVMPHLIIISNRVAVPGNEAPRQAGGLAVAVDAALKQREGIWFGWSGRVADDGAAPQPMVVRRQRRTFITLDLSSVDFQEYYNGFANRVLWPILHYRVDLAEFTSVELTGYLRVNALFANALCPFIQPDDVIWVHDSHLLSLAKELRARGHDNQIGFFLHIPCPSPDLLMVLPQHAETGSSGRRAAVRRLCRPDDRRD
jgi:trehalose-6-phosphate synthase